MAFDVTPVHVLGLAAGGAILALGVFVVLAQPRAAASRGFFLLAVADGTSSILFELRDMGTTLGEKSYFMATHEYFLIVFVGVLAGFGLLVPRPFHSRRARSMLVLAIAAVTSYLLVAYALDHGAFWHATVSGDAVTFNRGPGGAAIAVSFALATALILVRLARAVLSQEGTLRRQAAFIYGGMALGYGSVFAGLLFATAQGGFQTLRTGTFLTRVQYGAYLVAAVALLVSAAVILRAIPRLDQDVRRFLLGALSGVALFTVLPLVLPSTVVAVQVLALLAYPLLLGYAILRFAVFDIDAKLRRAASVALATTALSAIFITTENLVANSIQGSFSGFISSSVVASVLAGLVAALLILPIIRTSEKLAKRVVPALTRDEIHERKREIYRHSLAGALVDDSLDEVETRTLAALREALGITIEEHDALSRDVRASRRRAAV